MWANVSADGSPSGSHGYPSVMRDPASPNWLLVVVVASLVGVLASAGMNYFSTSPAPSPAPGRAARLQVDLERVIALLAARSFEDGVEAASGVEAPAASVSSSVTGPDRVVADSVVSDRLDRLEESVASLAELMRAQPSSVGAPIPRDVPINYREIEDLRALSVADPERARRSTVFLTPQQVAERFGFPDEMDSSGNVFFWTYKGPPRSEGDDLLIVFHSGYVALHEFQ